VGRRIILFLVSPIVCFYILLFDVANVPSANLSKESVLKKLGTGGLQNDIHSVPMLITKAKYTDIIKNCNEQLSLSLWFLAGKLGLGSFIIVANYSCSSCGILTNGPEWTFIYIRDGALYAVSDVKIDSLECVLAYVELFMKGEHLPPVDGVWPPPGPGVEEKFEKEEHLKDNPSLSEQYLGLNSSAPSALSGSTPAAPQTLDTKTSTEASSTTTTAATVSNTKPAAKKAPSAKPAVKKAPSAKPKPDLNPTSTCSTVTKKKRKLDKDTDEAYSGDSDELQVRPARVTTRSHGRTSILV
jgi:hypothetical protein